MFNKKENGKHSKKLIMLVLLPILLCVTAGALTTYYIAKHYDSAVSTVADSDNAVVSSDSAGTTNSSKSIQLDNNGSAIDGSIETKSQEQVLEELQKKQVIVTDKISSCIDFSNGKKGSYGSWALENVNSNTVIMQCDITINGRLIAKTVPVKPNQHVDKVALLDDVLAGTYDATATMNYFSLDSNEYISSAEYTIKIVVG